MDNNYIINIEKAILSTIFYDPITIDEIQEVLSVNDFYIPIHKIIYETMIQLNKDDLPIEEEFIKTRISNNNQLDVALVEIIATNAVVKFIAYAIELKEESKKRQINELLIQTKKLLNEKNSSSEDLLSNINKEIQNIENNVNTKEQTSKDILAELLKDMNNSALNIDKIGQKSGLTALDNIIGSFEDGDLIVIAARPSMGKTSIISAITNQSLGENKAVLIESLEMPAKKIMARLISARSGENLSDIKKGLIKNKEKFEEASNFFACENLIINDNTFPTLIQLISRIKRALRKNKNIKNIFIDHTGKIQLDGKTREDIEIGHITNNLKKIARDYNIRVFLLQQLNRSVESRENKRPMLSDLKNSGNIEEDADVVLGLYRHSYYAAKEKSMFENKIENSEIIILKNRDGETRTAKVSFEGRCARFIDREESNIPVIIEFGQ